MTPGNWIANLRKINWGDRAAVKAILAVAFGKGYYTVCSGGTLVALTLSDSKASAANATLMAAAPELQLALTTALEALDNPDKRGLARLQGKRALEKAAA